MEMARKDFVFTDRPNPHLARMREIIAAHPEVKDLYGPTPATALYATLLVAIQIALAIGLTSTPWWVILLLAYFVGGTINHALFVVLHECTHNLVFKKPLYNRLFALFANFPKFFPSSMQFFKYHMLHHTNQSEFDYDADLAGMREARWVGNSRFKKALVMFFFGFVQGTLRPSRLKKVKFYDGWFFVNVLTQVSFVVALYWLAGFWALFYLFLSTIFALGLHPMGGRWIQEHYIVREGQETNSYYGPLNKLCFNMGYHNEHHDFMKVAWSRLPKVKKIAPEFYDHLFYYKSWTACLLRFIFDKKVTFFDRIVHPSFKGKFAEQKIDTIPDLSEPLGKTA